MSYSVVSAGGSGQGSKNDDEGGIPRWDGNLKTWEEYKQRADWYMRGTKKEDRVLLAYRLAQKLTGAAYGQRNNFKNEEMEKETGVVHLLTILQANIVGNSINEVATKIIVYLLIHRLPGQKSFEYFTAHDDALSELEAALVAIGEEVKELPKKFVAFLFLERFGLDESEKAVVITKAGDRYNMLKVRAALQELWGDEALTAHDKKHFVWWKLRPRNSEKSGARGGPQQGKKPFGKFKRASANMVADDGDDDADDGENVYFGGEVNDDDGDDEDADDEAQALMAGGYRAHGAEEEATDEELVMAAQASEKATFEDFMSNDNELAEIYANFKESREALNAARQARGFYPVVAVVPPEMMRNSSPVRQTRQQGASAPKRSAAPKGQGKGKGKSSGPAPVCMICGGPHLTKDHKGSNDRGGAQTRGRSGAPPSSAGAPHLKRARAHYVDGIGGFGACYMVTDTCRSPCTPLQVKIVDCDHEDCRRRVKIWCQCGKGVCGRHWDGHACQGSDTEKDWFNDDEDDIMNKFLWDVKDEKESSDVESEKMSNPPLVSDSSDSNMPSFMRGAKKPPSSSESSSEDEWSEDEKKPTPRKPQEMVFVGEMREPNGSTETVPPENTRFTETVLAASEENSDLIILDSGATQNLVGADTVDRVQERALSRAEHPGLSFDPMNKRDFRFGNDESKQSNGVCTADAEICGRNLEYHSHVVPGGAPWLGSIGFLKATGAIIDFRTSQAVFANLDPATMVQLRELPSGHVAVPLNETRSGTLNGAPVGSVLRRMLERDV